MKRWWKAWIELWNRREAPTSLALTRFFVAAVVLFDLLYARGHGLVAVIWGPPPEGLGYGGVWDDHPAAAARWFGATVDTAWLMWWAAVVSAFMVLVGIATRVAAVFLALVLAQLGHIGPDGDRGIDFLLRPVLVIIALSSSHAVWSVDAWVRRRIGRPFPATVPSWPRYLIMAQMLWVYFSAGHNKTDRAWGPIEGYSALGNILCDPHFSRFECSWVATFYPLVQIGTAMTMVFEWSSPLMILLTYWSSTRERGGRLRRLANKLRLRWAWIATGIVFHIGIAVTMRLGIFAWGMLALYPVLVRPDELSRGWRWVARRLGRRVEEPAAVPVAEEEAAAPPAEPEETPSRPEPSVPETPSRPGAPERARPAASRSGRGKKRARRR